jgi:hypothetical protein
VRSTIGSSVNSTLDMSVVLQDGQAHLTLDVLTPSGDFLNGYQVEANIVAPNGESQLVALKQTAPGRYEVDFNPTEQGVYLIRFSGTSENGSDSFTETTGWTFSYSPEYKRIDSDPDLLLRLTLIGNGKIASSNPADIFTHDLDATRGSRPVWQWLILLAALLLPLDIALRRLIITKQDLVKAWNKLDELMGTYTRPKPVTPQPDPRMEALLQAKVRATENTNSSLPVDEISLKREFESFETHHKDVNSGKPYPSGDASSTAANLLDHKRSRRKNLDGTK